MRDDAPCLCSIDSGVERAIFPLWSQDETNTYDDDWVAEPGKAIAEVDIQRGCGKRKEAAQEARSEMMSGSRLGTFPPEKAEEGFANSAQTPDVRGGDTSFAMARCDPRVRPDEGRSCPNPLM